MTRPLPQDDDAPAGGAAPRWPDGLLAPHDPDPVHHLRADAASRVLLTCDHAGNAVPSTLDLGVSKQDLGRHIGIDIGALALAEMLSEQLGAELIAQRYSRLVIDCNRPPHIDEAMPDAVDGTRVAANAPPVAPAARVAEIFMPYHSRIAESLGRRAAAGERTLFVAIHSFTPVRGDRPGERPWPIAFLFNRQPALSHHLAQRLARDGTHVGLNEPYFVSDATDYGIPVHAERRGLASTLVEVRQDELGRPEGIAHWAERLHGAIADALDDF